MSCVLFDGGRLGRARCLADGGLRWDGGQCFRAVALVSEAWQGVLIWTIAYLQFCPQLLAFVPCPRLDPGFEPGRTSPPGARAMVVGNAV